MFVYDPPALAPLTIRTLLVEVGIEPGSGAEQPRVAHRFYPVVALSASYFRCYKPPKPENGRRNTEPTFPESDDHGAFVNAGWKCAYRGTEHVLLVLADDDRGVVPASEIFGFEMSVNQAVQCPWDHTEDESRLAPVIAKLTAELTTLLARQRVLTERLRTSDSPTTRPAAAFHPRPVPPPVIKRPRNPEAQSLSV
jgi:hypothetical protein